MTHTEDRRKEPSRRRPKGGEHPDDDGEVQVWEGGERGVEEDTMGGGDGRPGW
jgi:hypothetical protein